MFSFFLKVLLATFVLVVTVVFAGLSGATFRIWPTSLNDRLLDVTPATMGRLHKLEAERKFAAEAALFYRGAPNEAARKAAQKVSIR